MTPQTLLPRTDSIVIFAGAGISMAPPTSLPGWFQLASAIAASLSERLMDVTNEFGSLPSLLERLEMQRASGRLPPDYQAQMIEEMAGTRYFEGLQSIDVDVGNPIHEAIASLVGKGLVKAVVTTNFDRLIEYALERNGIPFVTARSDEEFARLVDRHETSGVPVPIIKIHGCVSSASSLIDTLKQRRRGRSQKLQACLDRLSPARWLFAGFSADDLQTDSNYLGFLDRAKIDHGAVFIRRPGSELRPGALKLKAAYGSRWEDVESEIAPWLSSRFGLPCELAVSSQGAMTGKAQFLEKLDSWARRLPPESAALCISALFEASGEGEIATRILDRLVRKSRVDDQRSDDFAACQLHYGRLGSAWGRFASVSDINGMESNASIESLQSLLRLSGTTRSFAANTWATTALLWRGFGHESIELAKGRLVEVARAESNHHTDENLADAWMAAAQVIIVDGGELLTSLLQTSSLAIHLAHRSGDVIRAARVAALHLLALAHTDYDVSAVAETYDQIFKDCARVHDGFVDGMRYLALGRWRLGLGGQELRASGRASEPALRALEDLDKAQEMLDEQVLDPWIVFLQIQRIKAFADLHQFEDAEAIRGRLESVLDRFPILTPHFYEAVGTVRLMLGAESEPAFEAAVQAAHDLGLAGREQILRQYLQRGDRADSSLGTE